MEVKKRRRRAIIWGLISFPLAVCLLLSLLSYWTPTHFAPWLPFWGLAFPFWFLSLGILSFVGYWIHRRGAVVATLVWLLGFPCATDYLSFHGPEETPPQGAIKVLSWNVNLFGFNFPQKRKMRMDMLQEVQNQHPDIVCFQEFFQSPNTEFDNVAWIRQNAGLPYYHAKYTQSVHNRRYSGVAIFSRFPIVNMGYVPFTNDTHNFCIYVDIVQASDTMRVYNAHLQSIRFKEKDYNFVENNKEQVSFWEGWLGILRKIRKASLLREDQALSVRNHMDQSPYPVMLVGDFNDPPVSYTYRTLSAGMRDAFDEKGLGTGKTYAGKFPQLRIDYQFVQDHWEVAAMETLPLEIVDHRPLVGWYRKVD